MRKTRPPADEMSILDFFNTIRGKQTFGPAVAARLLSRANSLWRLKINLLQSSRLCDLVRQKLVSRAVSGRIPCQTF
jgi:hypothetical protein